MGRRVLTTQFFRMVEDSGLNPHPAGRQLHCAICTEDDDAVISTQDMTVYGKSVLMVRIKPVTVSWPIMKVNSDNGYFEGIVTRGEDTFTISGLVDFFRKQISIYDVSHDVVGAELFCKYVEITNPVEEGVKC